MSYLSDLVSGLAIGGAMLVVGGALGMAAGAHEEDAPGWASTLVAAFIAGGILVVAWSPIVALIAWVVS